VSSPHGAVSMVAARAGWPGDASAEASPWTDVLHAARASSPSAQHNPTATRARLNMATALAFPVGNIVFTIVIRFAPVCE